MKNFKIFYVEINIFENSIYLADVEIDLTVECDIEHRDGKDYMKLKHVQSSLDIDNFKIDFQAENINANLVNSTFNSSWRAFLKALNPILEKQIANTFKDIFSKIGGKTAIQDVIDQ